MVLLDMMVMLFGISRTPIIVRLFKGGIVVSKTTHMPVNAE